MKKSLMLVICTMILSGCGSSAIDEAKEMFFVQTKTPIAELLKSHPAIGQDSIMWGETDATGNRRGVRAQFTFKNRSGEQQRVLMEFAIGRKSGYLDSVTTYLPTGEKIACAELGVFLVVLENKGVLDFALRSYQEKIEEELRAALYKDCSLVSAPPRGYPLESLGLTYGEFLRLLDRNGLSYATKTSTRLIEGFGSRVNVLILVMGSQTEEMTLTFRISKAATIFGEDWLCIQEIMLVEGVPLHPTAIDEGMKGILQKLQDGIDHN